MPRYDNIFLTDTGTAIGFTSTPKRGGSPVIPLRSDRKAHKENLLVQDVFRAVRRLRHGTEYVFPLPVERRIASDRRIYTV